MKLDWKLLREQKLALLGVLRTIPDKVTEDHLTGILHLIDRIQDEAVENGDAAEAEVFLQTYEVEIEGRITKKIRIVASNREDAITAAQEQFDARKYEESDEYYEHICSVKELK
jgi:septum formation inhibitor-activating ATPase MinD